jgi:hypothetical protein
MKLQHTHTQIHVLVVLNVLIDSVLYPRESEMVFDYLNITQTVSPIEVTEILIRMKAIQRHYVCTSMKDRLTVLLSFMTATNTVT